jgi:hypothetical protein
MAAPAQQWWMTTISMHAIWRFAQPLPLLSALPRDSTMSMVVLDRLPFCDEELVEPVNRINGFNGLNFIMLMKSLLLINN